jgi:LacI family transcriptional regulator
MGIVQSMSRPTIMDVARLCGVSKTTVSVILNQSPASARVPQETRQRVRVAAEQLGYRPSWRARALTSRKTHMIGILYAPPMPLIVRGNYEGIIAGINEVLQGAGYHVLFMPLGENRSDWGNIVFDQRIDGCLVLSRLEEPLASALLNSRLPLALVNADTSLPLPMVLADDYGGSKQTLDHLLGLGHERIAFLLGEQPPHYSVVQRTAAYMDAMKAAGFEQHAQVLTQTPEQFVQALAGNKTGPTAVIAYTHYMAVRLLRLLWDAGLKVPDDMSVSTFTNVFPTETTIPPLTTVALPTEEMGRAAAGMVVEQLKNDGATERKRLVLEESLIVRRSTAPPPR